MAAPWSLPGSWVFPGSRRRHDGRRWPDRWVKQNLRIKKFLGTSEHAIKLQIISALIAYLLLRLAQNAWPTPPSLQHLARLARANLMHPKTLADLLHPPPRPAPPPASPQLAMDLSHAHA